MSARDWTSSPGFACDNYRRFHDAMATKAGVVIPWAKR